MLWVPVLSTISKMLFSIGKKCVQLRKLRPYFDNMSIPELEKNIHDSSIESISRKPVQIDVANNVMDCYINTLLHEKARFRQWFAEFFFFFQIFFLTLQESTNGRELPIIGCFRIFLKLMLNVDTSP